MILCRISSRRLGEACWRLCRSISDRPSTQLLLTVASHPSCSVSQRVLYRHYRTLRPSLGSYHEHIGYKVHEFQACTTTDSLLSGIHTAHDIVRQRWIMDAMTHHVGRHRTTQRTMSFDVARCRTTSYDIVRHWCRNWIKFVQFLRQCRCDVVRHRAVCEQRR